MRIQTRLIHVTMLVAVLAGSEAIAQVNKPKLPCNEFCRHWMGYDKATTEKSQSVLHADSTTDHSIYPLYHGIRKLTRSSFSPSKYHVKRDTGPNGHFGMVDAVSVSRAPDAGAQKLKLSRTAIFPSKDSNLPSRTLKPQAAMRAEAKKSASLGGPELIAVPGAIGPSPKAASSGPLPSPSDNVEHSTANLRPQDQSRHSGFAHQPLVVDQSPSVENREENAGGSRPTRQSIQKERDEMAMQAIKALKLIDQEGL